MDIYVVVRKDLQNGRKCAQVAHAVAGLVYDWGQIFPSDIEVAVNYGRMIVLEVDKEAFTYAKYPSFPSYKFFEPDLNNELTAIAFLVGPEDRERFRGLPLAYPQKKKWWKVW